MPALMPAHRSFLNFVPFRLPFLPVVFLRGAPDNWARRRVALAVFAGAFCVYALCVAPTVTYGGDCGELIAASYRLGIAHPTGYPLYCLLGRTFASLLPIGEIGWRYNIFSALCASLAVGLVAATVHRLASAEILASENLPHGAEKSTPESRRTFDADFAAAGAGALLAGMYYFSTQATIAEVYALNALMLSALIYGAVAWHQSADFRWLYSCAALFGLALTAHLSCVYLAPGLFFYVIVQHRARLGNARRLAGHLACLVLLFAAAWALTLYLPIRSRAFPAPLDGQWWPLDWTHPVDFPRWMAHVSAQQYKVFLWRAYEIPLAGHTFRVTWFAQPFAQTQQKLGSLAMFLALQFLWCTPFLVFGTWLCWRRDGAARRAWGGCWLAALLVPTAVLNIGVQIHYVVGDQSNFFFPAYIVFAVMTGLGIARALRLLRGGWAVSDENALGNASGESVPRAAKKLSRAARSRVIIVLWVGSACVMQWTTTSTFVSHRGETQARDTALERAAIVEKLANSSGRAPYVVLSSDNALWGFWYARYVLGRAPNCYTPWGRFRSDNAKSDNAKSDNAKSDNAKSDNANGDNAKVGSIKDDRVTGATLASRVTQWRRSGEVVLSAWDEEIDRKFPLVMLSPRGDLCLASSRALPLPARLLSTESSTESSIEAAPRAATRDRHIERAAFRSIGSRARGAKIMSLKRSDLAAFDIDFWLRATPSPLAGAAALDPKNQAAQIGWIEVFLARAGRFKRLAPDQGDVRTAGVLTAPLAAWRQARRLVVPLNLKVRPNSGVLLRASVPLQLEPEAQPGRHNVWIRLTRTRDDKRTPWTKIDDVLLSGN